MSSRTFILFGEAWLLKTRLLIASSLDIFLSGIRAVKATANAGGEEAFVALWEG